MYQVLKCENKIIAMCFEAIGARQYSSMLIILNTSLLIMVYSSYLY